MLDENSRLKAVHFSRIKPSLLDSFIDPERVDEYCSF